MGRLATDLPVGAAIRMVRFRRSMSQEEVERRAGCAQGYISRLEKDRPNLSLQTFVRISAALEVRPDRMLKLVLRQLQPSPQPQPSPAQPSPAQPSPGI